MANQIPVELSDGSVLHLKPVPFSKLEDLATLQTSLLLQFIELDGKPGDLLRLSNQATWSALDSVCHLLPTVEGDTLDPRNIQETDDIVALFFTQTLTRTSEGIIYPEKDEEGVPQLYEPSRIAALHGFSFFLGKEAMGLYQIAFNQYKSKMLAAQEKASRQEEEVTPPEQKVDQPQPLPS